MHYRSFFHPCRPHLPFAISLCFMAHLSPLCAAEISPGDWPRPKHDSGLTNRSPLTNTLERAPRQLWKLNTGVWSGNINVTAGAGAKSLSLVPPAAGVTPPPLSGTASGVRQLDVDGDGKPEPIRDGYWAKLLPNVPGLQRVAWSNTWSDEPAKIQCFSYAAGLDKPKLEWETENVTTVYSPQILLADVNGDGKIEVATALHYRVMIFDGATGKKLHEIKYHNRRNYGHFGLFFNPGDPNAKFVTISDFANHFDVIDFDGHELKVAFRREIDDNPAVIESGGISRHRKIVRPGPNPLEDIDGDKRADLTFNFYDDEGDERWHVVSYEPLTGQRKLDLAGQYLIGLYDIDGDGAAELFCQELPQRQTSGWSKLSVLALRNGKVETLYTLPKGRFADFDIRFLPSNIDISGSTAASNTTVAAGAIGGQGERGFIVLHPGTDGRAARAEALLWKNGKAVPGWSVNAPPEGTLAVRHVAGRDTGDPLAPNRPASVLFNVSSPTPNAKLNLIGARARLQTWDTTSKLPPAPITVSSGSKRYLISETSNDRIAAYELVGKGTPPRLLWQRPGRGMSTGSGPGGGLIAGDLDGDGQPEIVYGVEDEATGAAAITAVSLAGKTLWTQPLPGYDSERPPWNFGGLTLWSLGHLTDPQRLDVYAMTRRSSMHSDVSFALDGRTGKILWTSDSVPVDGKPTWGFGGNPVAMADLQGNGLEQIVSDYPVAYYVVDGRNAEFIRSIDLANTILDGWAAYGLPVVADFLGNGKKQVLIPSPWVYGLLTPEGKALWSNSTGVIAPNAANVSGGQVGDFDGDGKLEVVRLLTAASPKNQDGLELLDGATGQRKFAPMPRGEMRMQACVAADVNGDGADELLLRVAPNALGALSAKGGQWTLLWQVALPAEPMQTIVSDIDGNGTGEIIVGCNDGSVVALGK